MRIVRQLGGFALVTCIASVLTVGGAWAGGPHRPFEVPEAAEWTWEGCWSWFPTGCQDIFRDARDNYWMCGKCETTENPSAKTCVPVRQESFQHGYWCA